MSKGQDRAHFVDAELFSLFDFDRFECECVTRKRHEQLSVNPRWRLRR